jgi:hypothetical protein
MLILRCFKAGKGDSFFNLEKEELQVWLIDSETKVPTDLLASQEISVK